MCSPKSAIFGDVERDADLCWVDDLEFLDFDTGVIEEHFGGVFQTGAGERDRLLVPALYTGWIDIGKLGRGSVRPAADENRRGGDEATKPQAVTCAHHANNPRVISPSRTIFTGRPPGASSRISDFETEAVIERGGEVFDGERVILRLARRGIGGAVDVPAGDAAAGHDDGENLRPVVAAGGAVDLGCAAEFGRHAHHRGIEQFAAVEIMNQRGKCLVEHRELALHSGGDVVVMVPTGVGERDEADAGFDKSPGQQHARSRFVAAILVANSFGFLADVEGLARFLRADHCIRALVVGIDSVQRIGLFDLAEVVVDDIKQFAALGEAGIVDVAGPL